MTPTTVVLIAVGWLVILLPVVMLLYAHGERSGEHEPCDDPRGSGGL